MYKVVGIELREYTNKSGERRKGYNVHCTCEDAKTNLEGLSVETFWLNPETLNESDIVIGSTIEVYYNKYGSITKVMHAH